MDISASATVPQTAVDEMGAMAADAAGAADGDDSQTVEVGVTISVRMNNPGQPVTVTPPEDLDGYMDQDAFWEELPGDGEYSLEDYPALAA